MQVVFLASFALEAGAGRPRRVPLVIIHCFTVSAVSHPYCCRCHRRDIKESKELDMCEVWSLDYVWNWMSISLLSSQTKMPMYLSLSVTKAYECACTHARTYVQNKDVHLIIIKLSSIIFVRNFSRPFDKLYVQFRHKDRLSSEFCLWRWQPWQGPARRASRFSLLSSTCSQWWVSLPFPSTILVRQCPTVSNRLSPPPPT